MKASKVFKSLVDCIELEKTGSPAETGFEFVFNCEDTEFETFDLHGDIEAQLADIKENSRVMIVESGEQPFDEFTSVICDAYANEPA